MTFRRPSAPQAVRALGAPQIIARARFRYQPRRLSLDALTGQPGTLTRAASGTGVDGLGATYTAVHSMPRWESRSVDAARLPEREALGLRLVADDLTWPVAYTPAASTIVFDGAEGGTRTTAGAALWYLGNDAQTGARMYVASDGTNYGATLYNGVGSNNVSVSLSGAAPALDALFQMTLQVEESDDATQFRIRLVCDVRYSAGEVDSGWSAYLDKPSAWGAGAKMRVNRQGDSGTQGSTWLRELADEYGVLSAADVLERL